MPTTASGVTIEFEGRYQKGRSSVDEYIEQTSIANPHVKLVYHTPEGEIKEYPRTYHELPTPPREIKPHPYGVELGVLMQMFRDTKARNLRSCLSVDFSRVSSRTAGQICEKGGVAAKRRPSEISREEAERVHHAIQKTKIMAPPTDCIAPIGEELIETALRAEVAAERLHEKKLHSLEAVHLLGSDHRADNTP